MAFLRHLGQLSSGPFGSGGDALAGATAASQALQIRGAGSKVHLQISVGHEFRELPRSHIQLVHKVREGKPQLSQKVRAEFQLNEILPGERRVFQQSRCCEPEQAVLLGLHAAQIVHVESKLAEVSEREPELHEILQVVGVYKAFVGHLRVVLNDVLRHEPSAAKRCEIGAAIDDFSKRRGFAGLSEQQRGSAQQRGRLLAGTRG